jgi:transcriptional regulator with XRE-family HTH domain
VLEPLRFFGQAVRLRRQRRGLSQEALGDAAALDRTYISGIERGVRNPTLLSIERIAGALECSSAQLVSDAEEAEKRHQ